MQEKNHLQHEVFSHLNGIIIFSVDDQYCYTGFTDSHKMVMKRIWGVDIALGHNMLDYIHREDDRRKAKANFDRVLAGETFIVDEEYGDETGHTRSWWEDRYSPIRDAENKIVGVAVFVLDITERKQEEAKVRFQAFVMNKVSSAVISTDVENRITYWNKGAEVLYGWKESEVLGKLVDEVCATEFLDGQQDLARQILLAQKSWHGELKQCDRTGKEIWVDASVTLLEDENGRFVGGVTINHNVTERKLTEDELRRTRDAIEQINLTLRRAFEREQLASRTDGLTGVFNRRYFFELLGYEFAASRRYERPLSLVMFDVDFLKKTNDTYGHQVGDELLRKAAEIVRGELRLSDVLARYGGDEFVILLSNSDEHDAVKVLKRIHHKMQSAFIEVGQDRLSVTISAGVASLKPDMDSANLLVKQADSALYVAKNSGRNRISLSNEETEEE